MTTINVANITRFPFRGWRRVAMPGLVTPETAVAHQNDRDLEVLGGRLPADLVRLVPVSRSLPRGSADLHVGLDAGGSFSFATKVLTKVLTTGVEHEVGVLVDPIAKFGGPLLFQGQPMDVLSWAQVGAGYELHARRRSTRGDRMLTCDVWLRWYPGESWATGEALLVASNPSSPVMAATTDDTMLRFGDAVTIVVGRGITDQLMPVRDGDWIADGQGRAVPVVFVWPRLARGMDYSSVAALAEGGVIAVCPEGLGLDGDEGPGMLTQVEVDALKRLAPDPLSIGAEVMRVLHTWDAPRLGPNRKSGDTGEQEDQVFPRRDVMLRDPLRSCAVAAAAYYSALKMFARPCHYRDADGRPTMPDGTSAQLLWDGRPHVRAGATLQGKPRELDTIWETRGWAGPDVEHSFQSSALMAAQLFDSPALRELFASWARIYPRQWTTTPGWSTTQPYASRAVGWECAMVLSCLQVLPRSTPEAAVVVSHFHARLRDVIVPDYRDKDVVDVRYNDPRLGPGPWLICWQQAVAAYYLDRVARTLTWLLDTVLAQEVSTIALRLARWVVENGYTNVGTDEAPQWHSWSQMPVGGLPPGAPSDGGFNYFGMSLAVAVVLKHEPTNARALSIWRYIVPRVPYYRDLKWLAPEVLAMGLHEQPAN